MINKLNYFINNKKRMSNNYSSSIRIPDLEAKCQKLLFQNRIYKKFDKNIQKKICKKFISLCLSNEHKIFCGNIESYSKEELIEEVILPYINFDDDFDDDFNNDFDDDFNDDFDDQS